MRIFLSCQQALRDHPVPSYGFWRYYFMNALAEAGHEVVEAPGVDWAEGLLPLSPAERFAWADRAWGPTVEFIRREHGRRKIDLFLGYLFPEQVEPGAVRTISRMGIPTVNFFCDNIREFSDVPDSYCNFDLNWVPEADARQMYSRKGLNFIYAPMPMWVAQGFRSVPSDENKDVLFIGSHDALREDLLGDVSRKGLDFRVYGAGWIIPGRSQPARRRSVFLALSNQFEFIGKHGLRGLAMRATYRRGARKPSGWVTNRAHDPLGGDAYFEATRHARVVLGINRCPSFRRSFSDPIRYSRLRDIEAPMLGACYLTEMAPGLEDLFQLGIEIETYRTAEELVEKATLLSRDPEKRLDMRRRGQSRALADHTVARTLARISEKLGLAAKT
jgi:hypothetical protein